MKEILVLESLSAFYGASQVLFDVNVSVRAGQITALLGANGAGKTTTLRAVCRAVKSSGKVLLDGNSIGTCNTEAVARLGVAHVPDDRGTFADLSVDENLLLGAYTRSDPSAVAADIEKMFDRFPRLRERRHQQAGTLSGGEQQMLAIARALMLRPRLLLLDEPSFGLAPLIVGEIFRILQDINREENVAILLVEQNAKLALSISQEAYVLETGRVALSGSSQTIAEDEGVRKSYLGY